VHPGHAKSDTSSIITFHVNYKMDEVLNEIDLIQTDGVCLKTRHKPKMTYIPPIKYERYNY